MLTVHPAERSRMSGIDETSIPGTSFSQLVMQFVIDLTEKVEVTRHSWPREQPKFGSVFHLAVIGPSRRE